MFKIFSLIFCCFLNFSAFAEGGKSGFVVGALGGYQLGHIPIAKARFPASKNKLSLKEIFSYKGPSCPMKGGLWGFSLGYETLDCRGVFWGLESVFNFSKAKGGFKGNFGLAKIKGGFNNVKNFEFNYCLGYKLATSSFIPFLKLGYGLNQMHFLRAQFLESAGWGAFPKAPGKFWMHSLVLGGGLNILLSHSFSLGISSCVHLSRNKVFQFLLGSSSGQSKVALNVRNMAVFNTLSVKYDLAP